MPILLLALKPELIPEPQLARLQTLAAGYDLIISEDRDVWEEAMAEAEIVAGWATRSYLEKAPRLRWYQQWGAGVDWLRRHPQLAARPFVLTNVSGLHAIPISEHIFALLLALARRLPQALAAQAQHQWRPAAGETLFELAGKTMLVIGLGPIGRRTAQVANAFGMRVLGVRYSPEKAAEGVARVFGFDQLLGVLPEADFVVLTTPLTSRTVGLIDEQALQAMKPTAYLVNIGRGVLIDEPALIEALAQGRIAGAGLDVVAEEPLAAESPLWAMENVVITAHYAGATPNYHERAMEIFLENLSRYRRGEPLINVVDKTNT